MKSLRLKQIFAILSLTLYFINNSDAQNPFIRDQFTADPTARVFGDRVYVYPSHDIPASPGRGRANWFVMEDYHVFSSSNLTDWTDHGVIVSQNKVNWVDSTSFSMWAPDCIERNGKYYFYFPSNQKPVYGKGFTVGVAVSDKPSGPFVPQAEPIKNVRGIDPNVLIDKDGQAYLYWSQGNIFGAKLKENMLELASEVSVLTEFPQKGLKEGPFVFERNGIYYMTYPHVQNKIERLEYATGNNPMGPFKFAGVIMDETPMGTWTNHHSIIEFRGQWYLFYHQSELSPKFDKNRSVRIDSLFFNNDGSIRTVKPTNRGVGLTDALKDIQIDRYSNKSETGVSIVFNDTLNTFKGWKTIIGKQNSWISYNAVDFGKKKLKSIQVRAFSQSGGTLQIRLDKSDGPLIAEVKIPKGTSWIELNARLLKFQPGIHNVFVSIKDNNPVEVDWIRFLK